MDLDVPFSLLRIDPFVCVFSPFVSYLFSGVMVVRSRNTFCLVQLSLAQFRSNSGSPISRETSLHCPRFFFYSVLCLCVTFFFLSASLRRVAYSFVSCACTTSCGVSIRHILPFLHLLPRQCRLLHQKTDGTPIYYTCYSPLLFLSFVAVATISSL